jgi:hypothetical protein
MAREIQEEKITDLKLATALGAMQIIRAKDYAEIFELIGVTEAEYKLTTQSKPWLARDRSVVRSVLDATAAGVMDAVGCARFEMPAEYIAAVVVSFVHPTNIQVACRWLEAQRPGDVIQGATSTAYTVSPAEVFVLCCKLLTEPIAKETKNKFEKNVKFALGVANSQGG